MNGTSFLKNTSKAFPTEWTLPWWEALMLMGAGVLTVILHRSFDASLSLPGHHGIEWMALMVIGRLSSRYRGAGTLTSVGASLASMVPMWHGGDPFTPLLYMLPGPLMDAAFRYLPGYVDKVWFLMFVAGLAHMTKPVTRLLINFFTGWPFGSFRFGIAYPVLGHFFYGAIGGLLGALIILGLNKLSEKQKP